MSVALKNLSDYDAEAMPNAESWNIGVVVANWNPHITHKMYESCYETLIKHGANPDKIYTAQVPGTFELPTAAKMLASSQNLDAVICLGCVIKGETKHDDYISSAVANSLAQMGMISGKPIVFGVITANNEQQAIDRAGGKHGNKGIEAAQTALKMIELGKSMTRKKATIGFA